MRVVLAESRKQRAARKRSSCRAARRARASTSLRAATTRTTSTPRTRAGTACRRPRPASRQVCVLAWVCVPVAGPTQVCLCVGVCLRATARKSCVRCVYRCACNMSGYSISPATPSFTSGACVCVGVRATRAARCPSSSFTTACLCMHGWEHAAQSQTLTLSGINSHRYGQKIKSQKLSLLSCTFFCR